MKPPPFEYQRPTSLDVVLGLLASHEDRANLLAGGQSLVPMMNFRLALPPLLIDINGLGGLDYHRVERGELLIGALTRHATLSSSPIVREVCPLMADAYRYVAHPAIRNRGTLCGNLCHADPASEMPAVMQAVSATMVLQSAGGERRVSATEFFFGQFETAKRANEMLIEVRIPCADPREGWAFDEVSPRRGDFAIVAVGGLLRIDGKKISHAAVVLAGVGERSVRLAAAEKALIGQQVAAASWMRAAEAAASSIAPQSDSIADASYRREAVVILVARVLAQAAARARS